MRTSMAGQDLQGGGKAMTRHVLAAGLAALVLAGLAAGALWLRDDAAPHRVGL